MWGLSSLKRMTFLSSSIFFPLKSKYSLLAPTYSVHFQFMMSFKDFLIKILYLVSCISASAPSLHLPKTSRRDECAGTANFTLVKKGLAIVGNFHV